MRGRGYTIKKTRGEGKVEWNGDGVVTNLFESLNSV
jgi:hypothetical protein